MESRIETGGLIPPVIQCDRCGKRKKVQRLGRRAAWRCSACCKAQIPKVQIACFWCEKTIELRRSKVDPSHYFLCGTCVKVSGTKTIEGFQKPGQIMIHKMHAAGEMTGFDIRYPTPEEAASVERARAIHRAAERIWETPRKPVGSVTDSVRKTVTRKPFITSRLSKP